MLKEKLIEELYNKLVSRFLENVTIERENLAMAYKDYLKRIYMSLEIDESNYAHSLEVFMDLEIKRWQNVPQVRKMSEFLKDEALAVIGEYSEKGLVAAKNKKFQNVVYSVDEAKDAIVKMEEYLSKVKDYHVELAKTYVSEGIMDYLYASNQTENRSLRFSRLVD